MILLHSITVTVHTRPEVIRKAQNFHLFDSFLRHAREGVLPNYSFTEPRYFSDIRLFPPRFNLPNDMHPSHGVSFGDQLVAAMTDQKLALSHSLRTRSWGMMILL